MTFSVRSVVLSSALLSFCVVGNAQHPPAVQTPQQPISSSASPQGTNVQPTQPSPELQNLIKVLSGRWSLAVAFEGSSNTGEVKGEEAWRPGPGGFTFLEEERLPLPSGDTYLLGVIWWDNITKNFGGIECNNHLSFTCDLKGALNDITVTWDGKQFGIHEWETHGGKRMLWHEVWSDITATSFTQTGESEQPGGTRKRLFTIHATRVAEGHQ